MADNGLSSIDVALKYRLSRDDFQLAIHVRTGGTRGPGRQAERMCPDAETKEAGTQRNDGGREAQGTDRVPRAGERSVKK